MPKLLDYFKDILTGKLRSSQLVVLFCSLVSTGGTYLLIREGKWFQSVKADFGSTGPLLLITVGFLLYLIVFQFALRICEKVQAVIQAQDADVKKHEQIVGVFHRLSDWQKDFLGQAVNRNKRQWQRHEMPSVFDAIWEPEVKALIRRNIVRQVNYDVFLIDDDFFDTLQEIYHSG